MTLSNGSNSLKQWLIQGWNAFRRDVTQFREEWSLLPDISRDSTQQAAEGRGAEIYYLRCLSDEELHEVEPKIRDAARVVVSRFAFAEALDKLAIRLPRVPSYVAATLTIAYLVISGALISGLPSKDIPVGVLFFLAYTYIYASVVIYSFDIRLPGDSVRQWVIFATLLTLMISKSLWVKAIDQTIAAAPSFRLWGQVFDARRSLAGSGVVMGTLLELAIFPVFVSVVITLVQLKIAAENFPETSASVRCAVVLDSLLEIALLIQQAIDGREVVTPFRRAWRWIPRSTRGTVPTSRPRRGPFVASRDHIEIPRQIESLARYIEGPWRRAIRTGDKAANATTDKLAFQIAFAVRRWKPACAIGGPDLTDARNAFAIAVLNVANDEWALMAASDATARQRISQRMRRWARVSAATLLLAGTSVFVAVNPFNWPKAAALSSAVVPGLLVVAQITSALDPGAGQRFDASARLLSTLGGKAGGS